MKFWDASSIIPLCLEEPWSPHLRRVTEQDETIIVWWATEEHIKGTLEVGKLADMVVLSQDLFTITPDDIPATRVLYTIVGGKIVCEK